MKGKPNCFPSLLPSFSSVDWSSSASLFASLMLVQPASISCLSSPPFSLGLSVAISLLSSVSSRLVHPPSSPLAPASRKKGKMSILHEVKTDKGGPASRTDCHLLEERSILQLGLVFQLILAVVKQLRSKGRGHCTFTIYVLRCAVKIERGGLS